MARTITDLYQEFCTAHGAETPIRSRDELQDIWFLTDLRYDDLDDPAVAAAWWTLIFSSDWAFPRGEDMPEDAWEAFDAAIEAAHQGQEALR